MTPIIAGSILKGVGSIGLSLIFWVIGYLFAAGGSLNFLSKEILLIASGLASLSVYLEYASYFPHRSGAEVAYLEKVRAIDSKRWSMFGTSCSHSGISSTKVPYPNRICSSICFPVFQQ